ncbi:hypothetical protein ACN6K9_002241 [Streptomyces sp. SAS_267]
METLGQGSADRSAMPERRRAGEEASEQRLDEDAEAPVSGRVVGWTF